MLKNYFKIAWRNLLKNKLDSFISIGGLAVGLACCLLLIFYVRFEWSFDNFHENSENIFRITTEETSPSFGEVNKNLATPYPLGSVLESAFPEIAEVVNIARSPVHIEEEGKFVRREVTFAGPEFFTIFTFPLLYGEEENALSDPNNIVLTESAALRYFGERQVIGESLTLRLHEEQYTFTVAGIVQSLPANSSMQFEIVLPFENYFRNEPPERRETARESWYIGFGETWVSLSEGASSEDLEAKFPPFLKTHLGDFAERMERKMGLQSLDGAYFNQEYTSYITGNSNRLYSIILGGIALIILAIAGMNFMSLTLSRAHRRQHEMGIRKATGAQSRQIIFQIFGEVLITCSIAFLIGLGLSELATPFFQDITGKSFEINIINDPLLWLILGVMILLLTIITGAYPAWKMSRKKVSSLFFSRGSTERIPFFVKGLICAQFTLAIAFLIATLIMNSQLSYLFNKDLGFSTSGVIALEMNLEREDGKRMAELFSNEARQISGVEQVSAIGSAYRYDQRMIEHGYGFGMGTMMSSTTLEGFSEGIISEIVDEYYLETLNIELIEGRNFSNDRPADIENGIIINKTFTERMGWDNPVGRVIEDEADWGAPFDGKEIIGVVEDFHFKPLYTQLQPIALQHIESEDSRLPQTILVKADQSSLGNTVERLSELWEKVLPEEVLNYHFMDELVVAQYEEEQRWKQIIQFASFIAIALACFGLFGLAALSAQRRTKEIGIRKVLGATVANIVGLLSKDFLKLVLLGFVIAVPIAWYAMNQWLQDFAYRIEIGVGIFLLAGTAAVLIALATVSWQSIRAALANPVDSLRSE